MLVLIVSLIIINGVLVVMHGMNKSGKRTY